MKKYYIANEEYSDSIYGSEPPICIDINEVSRLACEWNMTVKELMKQMHEASQEECYIYGTYNSV